MSDDPFKELREALAADASERVIWLASSTVASLLAALDAAEARARAAERERDAYRRAKAENDERFMIERDEARHERDAAQARVRRLKEAGNALHEQLMEWVDWLNFRDAGGLCACYDGEEYDVETVSPPVEHGELCRAWRRAIDGWRQARAALADGADKGET